MHLLSVVVIFHFLVFSEGRSCKKFPRGAGFIKEYFECHNYPLEAHNVTTEDEYVLTLHRIPHGRNSDKNVRKPVVLLMHGFFGTSNHWVVSGPGRALSFELADKGYDVWLGNARGCYHSRQHKTLGTEQHSTYWNYSFHEIGIYDTPAMIDYILKVTRVPNIYYIGHSQGTTGFFVMGSVKPEYNNKIKLMIALGPAAYIPKVIPNLKIMSDALELMVNKTDVPNYKIFTDDEKVSEAYENFCTSSLMNRNICLAGINKLCGESDQVDLKSTFQLMYRVNPGGVSFKQALHFGQIIKSKRFAPFDYGAKQNMKIYKAAEPPEYDLSKLFAPVALIYGENDILATAEDSAKIYKNLNNPVLKHKVAHKKFNHLDFLYGKDVGKYLYPEIFSLLKKY